jgi:hypothetical protein
MCKIKISVNHLPTGNIFEGDWQKVSKQELDEWERVCRNPEYIVLNKQSARGDDKIYLDENVLKDCVCTITIRQLF